MNKVILTFIAFLLVLPGVLAQVKVQLGEPYVNIEDFSEIRFTTHSDYYEICSLDKTIIPVLIKNNNKFQDTFSFEVDKGYASLPVKNAVLKSGKSAILPLTISPPIELEENTTIILGIITKREGLKRSVIIKTDIKRCYLFGLEIDKEKDELCGCDQEQYNVVLENNGEYTDIFTLTLEIPEWINSTLGNETITLGSGQKREIGLYANPSCEEKGSFTVGAKVISEKTEVVLEDRLELTVLPQEECYNTIISADNVDIDYFGKNIPITIRNRGTRDADYSLSIEGVEWYSLSQTEFSLKQNNEKTINLALYPGEKVVEGEYNIEIKAEANEREFTKSITVNLKKKGTVFAKLKFYLNYFRYYIGLGVVVLVILFFMVKAKKRFGKRAKKEALEEEAEETVREEKKIEQKERMVSLPQARIEKKKKAVKKVEWMSKRIVKDIFHLILYLVFLALLVLLTYSTFRYRGSYEKALNFVSGLFVKYIVPFASYMMYIIAGVCILMILLLVIDFLRKKPKEKRKKKKEIKGKVREEQPKEKRAEVKEAKKIIGKKRLKFFGYVYPILVILLLIAIIGYTIYRFAGKQISFDKLVLVTSFVESYLLYFIGGLVILFIIIFFLRRMEKKTKRKEKKAVKRAKIKLKIDKRLKRRIKNLSIIIIGLIVLSGIVYSFVYYDLISYIKDFFVVYYPYILMGIGVLVMLILILHFHNKKIS